MLLLKVVLSYLLGSLSGSLLLGKIRGGVDIRTLGSGNAGGTNALRTQGFTFALGVVVIDIAKGAIAAGVIAGLYVTGNYVTMLACGAAAVLGHVYPVWHGFRGGKGAATYIGVIAVVYWPLLLPILLSWIAVVIATGFVGLATMSAGVAAPIYYGLTSADPQINLLVFLVLMAVFMIFTHRSNIARMLQGIENRNKKLWLFGFRR